MRAFGCLVAMVFSIVACSFFFPEGQKGLAFLAMAVAALAWALIP